jgi:hypothetical protein
MRAGGGSCWAYQSPTFQKYMLSPTAQAWPSSCPRGGHLRQGLCSCEDKQDLESCGLSSCPTGVTQATHTMYRCPQMRGGGHTQP